MNLIENILSQLSMALWKFEQNETVKIKCCLMNLFIFEDDILQILSLNTSQTMLE